MPKLYYGEAMKLMARTLPCLGMLALANFLFGLAVVLYWTILYGLIYLTRNMSFIPLILFLVGTGGTWMGFKAIKKLVLYTFKAGHIAVMAELLKNGKLPEGASQIAFGKDQIKARFVEVGAMFAVDEIVKKVVGSINNMVDGALSLLKIDAFKSLGKLVMAVMSTAANYVDEAVLGKIFMEKEKSVWKVASDGTILYAMAWKPILTNAVGLALVSWASLVAFIILFLPAGMLVNAIFPGSIMSGVVVIVFALLAKATLVDTFATATTMIAFHKETATLQVDSAVERKLESVSQSFRELKAKASEKVSAVFSSKAEPATPPTLPPLPVAETALPPLPNNVVSLAEVRT